MASEYPKKLWWVVLIVVPLLVALIGGVFDRCGKDGENPQNETTYNIDNSIDNSKKTIIPATNSERAAIKRVMDEIKFIDGELQSHMASLVNRQDSIKNINDLHNIFNDIFVAISTMLDYVDKIDLSGCPKEFRFSVIRYRNQISALKTTLSNFISFLQRQKEQDPFGITMMFYQDQIKNDMERFMNLANKVSEAEKNLKSTASSYLPE